MHALFRVTKWYQELLKSYHAIKLVAECTGRIYPSPMKRFVKRLLQVPQAHQEDVELSLINHALNEHFALLPSTKLLLKEPQQKPYDLNLTKVKQDENHFADFLARYVKLKESAKENNSNSVKEFATLQEKHAVLCICADVVLSLLPYLQNASPVLDGIMRRFAFRHLSYLNTKVKADILDYKKSLPKIGLLFFPNAEVKDFLVDSLNGLAVIDDMEPGKLLERTWAGRPYDFHRYQNELKKRVATLANELPEDLVKLYPSRSFIEQEIFENIQYQFALVELLQQKAWDVIFIGANEVPLALLLFDLQKELLPPTIFLCHGMLAGDPVMDFWFGTDHTIARGKVEKAYFLRAGIDPATILEVGSGSLDAYPAAQSLQERRKHARTLLGLDQEQTVLIYATTYDVYREDMSTQFQEFLIESFRQCAELGGLKDPVLYLKYHPSPASDATFSYSRNQYPLENFTQLQEAGISVRLLSTLDDVLPAGDCFIAHESSTLFMALESAVPSVSINYRASEALPIMGFDIYKSGESHWQLNAEDGAQSCAKKLNELCRLDRTKVYSDSKAAWNNIFNCGRTESLGRIATLTKSILQSKLPAMKS